MKNKFLLILTFFYCTLTWTQVKFEAEVSKNKLGVNENLRIDFKMNKKEYESIPGTIIFDADRSREGYHLNQFCISLRLQ